MTRLSHNNDMRLSYRNRRLLTLLILLLVGSVSTFYNLQTMDVPNEPDNAVVDRKPSINNELAIDGLSKLSVKGRAPNTGYSRSQFGDGWASSNGCDTRNIILNRDLTDVKTDDSCHVISGVLQDPYTGKEIVFARGGETSDDVQIDHVVALSDAWQTGAQLLTKDVRIALANDPLELLAVDGPANQQKSGSNAASWLPSNKSFRCQYVARQISVKLKYNLWVTPAESSAVLKVLQSCPDQYLIK